MAIRYDNKLNAEIRKTVSNFNAKVSRLEQKHHQNLPSRVKVSELKSLFDNRTDLKRQLKQLQKFSERGIEEVITTKGGAKLTKYDVYVIKQQKRVATLRYNKQLSRIGGITPRVRGVKQSRTLAQMGDETISNLKAKVGALRKDIMGMSQTELNKFKNYVAMQYQNTTRRNATFLWDSYMQLIDDIAYRAGLDTNKVEEFKSKLLKMDPNKFYEMYKTENLFTTFVDYYAIQKVKAGVLSSDDRQQVQDNFESLYDLIDELIGEYS